MESRYNPGVRVVINRIRRKSISDCDVGHGAWRHGRRHWSIKATGMEFTCGGKEQGSFSGEFLLVI